jgi:hypothetical protein
MSEREPATLEFLAGMAARQDHRVDVEAGSNREDGL